MMISSELNWLAIASAGCAGNILFYIIAFRHAEKARHSRALRTGFCAGLALLLASTIALATSLEGFGAATVIYLCFSYSFFHFANMGETARRVRYMMELAASPGGLSQSQLLARYNAREMVDRRLDRLAQGGQAKLEDNRYYLARPSARAMPAIVHLLKVILNIEDPLQDRRLIQNLAQVKERLP